MKTETKLKLAYTAIYADLLGFSAGIGAMVAENNDLIDLSTSFFLASAGLAVVTAFSLQPLMEKKWDIQEALDEESNELKKYGGIQLKLDL